MQTNKVQTSKVQTNKVQTNKVQNTKVQTTKVQSICTLQLEGATATFWKNIFFGQKYFFDTVCNKARVNP